MLVIDRFEGEWAVLEYDGTVFNVPRSLLPTGAREGDVIDLVARVDESATEKRRQKVKELEDELFR